ncbi:TAXI family TRAP transporter solute-binding subunit [Aneurinibacillus tyrosinisolvens]|uniref:TAXI family TRAP transporter solute-binding subunit n=1 Tax=Aneurinibacillus tyrosinisolvens TaxID=1443435 RepID=UPI00063EE00C|nr:TAXI family TRAP transporter solute-binding subunit [Aneurinibacillus tyrosinisolvens]
MKIRIIFILSLLMLAISGCSGNLNAQSTMKQAATSGGGNSGGPLNVTVVGGSAGGLWSVVGEGIGETLKRTYPGTTFTYTPGQDGANVITVMQGQAQFGIVSTPSAKWAYEGKDPYPSKVEKVRAVAFLHAMPYHFTVSQESGINSIEQIVKEKYPLVAAVNTKNSPMEMTNRVVFESYGSSYKDIENNRGKIQYLAISKANDLIKDNKMQASISPLPLPAANLVELNVSKPIKLLPLNENAIKNLEEKVGAKPYTIKAGTYPFVKEDIPTAAVDTILITSADVPDEVVYKTTKAIYDNLKYLYTVHHSFKDMTKESIAKVMGAPLHPGAEKFYKEVGILK